MTSSSLANLKKVVVTPSRDKILYEYIDHHKKLISIPRVNYILKIYIEKFKILLCYMDTQLSFKKREGRSGVIVLIIFQEGQQNDF